MPIRVRRLKITDASCLKAGKVLVGTNAECENKTRSLVNMSGDDIISYVAYIKETREFIALIKVVIKNWRNATLEISVGEKELDQNTIKQMLDFIIYECFYKHNIHKLSITVYETCAASEETVLDLGFVQEAVLHSEIKQGNEYFDAGLFYITPAVYKGYNICFVPYRRGILAVYGAEDYVDRIDFLRYGAEAQSGPVSEAAYYMDIVDENNCYLPNGAKEYEYDADDLSFLPSELVKAFSELKEYFIKHREVFDINVVFSWGTEFQQSVWNSLKEIPYGATWSYYDLAYKLSGDKQSALKLTRAVGSACSENPIPVVVPCHRVLGKNGKLVGFAGGLDIKDYLLQLEAFPYMML